MAIRETWEVGPEIVAEILSDGSKVHNVVIVVDGVKITIACEGQRGACAVVKALEANVSWYMAEPQARAA